MEADKDAVIANATVDSEVILARGGKPTLQARLDDTTAQLAQTEQQLNKSDMLLNGYIYLSSFPRLGDEKDDMERFKRATYQCLVENKPLFIGRETIVLSETLASDQLHAVSIIGLGKGISILKFVGNIDAFNFDAVGKFFMDYITIELDLDNTKAAFRIAPVISTAHSVTIGDNVEVRCPGYAHGGNFTGVYVTGTEKGSYDFNFGAITFHRGARGIYFDSVSPATGVSWATSYVFDSPVVLSYKTIGIGIEMNQSSGVQLSNITFKTPRVHDNETTQNKRIAYLIDGQFNTWIGITHWADTLDKDNSIGMKFVDRNLLGYNVITGGHVEGEIVNKHMMQGNTCDFMHAPNTNNPFWTSQKGTIQNILPNPTFKDGLKGHILYNTTATIQPDSIPTGRKLTLSTTGINGQIMTNLRNKTAMIGQTINVFVSFKSLDTIRLVIDEGVDRTIDEYIPDPNATGYRTVRLSRKITTDNDVLAVSVMAIGESGKSCDIAFIYASIVKDTQVPSTLDVNDLTNYGSGGSSGVIVSMNTDSLVVTHNLGYIPNAEDIILTSTSTLGSAKHFWIENITNTDFTIRLDVAPGGGINFSWRILSS